MREVGGLGRKGLSDIDTSQFKAEFTEDDFEIELGMVERCRERDGTSELLAVMSIFIRGSETGFTEGEGPGKTVSVEPASLEPLSG